MTIELYGTARIRAGVARVSVTANNLAQALESLAVACPALSETIVVGSAIHPAFRLSLNGERFVSDPAQELIESDCLLLLSADVGG